MEQFYYLNMAKTWLKQWFWCDFMYPYNLNDTLVFFNGKNGDVGGYLDGDVWFVVSQCLVVASVWFFKVRFYLCDVSESNINYKEESVTPSSCMRPFYGLRPISHHTSENQDRKTSPLSRFHLSGEPNANAIGFSHINQNKTHVLSQKYRI